MIRIMKNQEKQSTKEYLRSALRGTEERLLHNPSKGEQALFLCTVLLAFAALVLSAVTAIMSKDASAIIRSLSENVVYFILIAALTVSDKLLVVRGKYLILIIYSLVWLVRDGCGFIGAGGFMTVLAVLGVLSGIALYGVLIFDQFNTSDHPVKYWLIYGGSLYKILYTLVTMIINGSRAAGADSAAVVGVLATVITGLTNTAVILMLLYQFDGFSFARYMYYRIIDADADGEPEEEDPDTTDTARTLGDTPYKAQEHGSNEAGYVPYTEVPTDTENAIELSSEQPQKAADSGSHTVNASAAKDKAPAPERARDDVLDDFGYVPYDDSDDTATVDGSVKPVGAAEIKPSRETDRQQTDNTAADSDDDVLIDESVMNFVSATDEKPQENKPATDDKPQEDKSATDESPAHEPLRLTPTELRYVRFAAGHHKPEETLQVEGLSGDLFDVWVDGETICFLNDLDQATGGRGVRTAAIDFGDVEGIGFGRVGESGECIVLTYSKDDELREIGFTKESFANFKRVMTSSES